MKELRTRFTPRSRTITVRVRPESEENLEEFCKENGFKKSELIDLILKNIKNSTKGYIKDLKDLQKQDYPFWQD